MGDTANRYRYSFSQPNLGKAPIRNPTGLGVWFVRLTDLWNGFLNPLMIIQKKFTDYKHQLLYGCGSFFRKRG